MDGRLVGTSIRLSRPFTNPTISPFIGAHSSVSFLSSLLDLWNARRPLLANTKSCRRGAFHFSQATLPLLLKSTDLKYPPTLIFTGATAAMKGSAMTSAFSTGKFALRSLTQSLSKEFGPKGVHITHAIIDGIIDIPKTKEWKVDEPDGKISPDAVR